uniref:Tumor necrosis factor receptor superfamily member 6B n=1 Tax=Pogona vitticeps TaxID=103695 RepID=A0ABM5G552_9SAUR
MISIYKQMSLRTNLSTWMVFSLPLLSLPGILSQPTYKWKDHQTNEIHECQQCPPGTHVAEPCTAGKQTVCKPCPENYYTEFWNYLDSCLYCNMFCNSLEEEARPCNRTHNRECQCKPGYHVEWDFCQRHSKCPLGSRVMAVGNPREDTKCTLCPPGTFSYLVSSTEPCRAHQNCSAQGLEVNVPGNRFHDTFCTSCKLSQEDRGDRPGMEVCQEALIDFIPYEIKSVRRLNRLKRIVSRSLPSGMNQKTSYEELQVELHRYLTRLKDTEGADSVFKKLWGAIGRMSLQHLQEKIKKRFPIGL